MATLLSDALKHQAVDVIDDKNRLVGRYQALQAIPFGNKMALHAIASGQPVSKAGHAIGVAISAIPAGELVHVQNVRSQRLDIPPAIIGQIIDQMRIETE
ncbi:SAF domain-containing protein [Oceanimonas sp. NS1]|nr:SAF domain-containing protein [Oceanimonas sp. NS1]